MSFNLQENHSPGCELAKRYAGLESHASTDLMNCFHSQYTVVNDNTPNKGMLPFSRFAGAICLLYDQYLSHPNNTAGYLKATRDPKAIDPNVDSFTPFISFNKVSIFLVC